MRSVLREFWGDVKESVRAWRVAPLLPLITLALQLAFYLPQFQIRGLPGPAELLAGIAILGGMLFYIGYVGTERLWYLAAWTRRPFGLRDVWTNSWRYFGRYLALALITMILSLMFFVPGAVINAIFDLGWSGTGPEMITPTILIDVWLTFMTPALAYSTDRTSEAISIGWRMLKDHWRHCFIYALAPPLAGIVLLQRASPELLATPLRLGLAFIGTLVYLALKGATAAYYVRHYPVSVEELAAAGRERPRRVTAR